MPKLTVTHEGETKHIDAAMGLSVMEILRQAGYPILGECNGSVSCATCHVIVAKEWFDKLPSQSEDEEDILDTVFNLEATSRLSCQIMMYDTMDGLALSIPE